MRKVTTLGLFEKRIEGDDCLLELARLRFCNERMGAEMHAGTPDQLEKMLRFRPWSQAPVTVHLPRDFYLADEISRDQIVDFARRFAGRVSGLIIHDHPEMAAQKKEYIEAAWKLERRLEGIQRCPTLFVEYAAGLAPVDFADFFSAIPDLEHVSACIDIGHVGMRAARTAYSRTHPGADVCALKKQGAELPQLVDDVQAAVVSGSATVLELVEMIGALKKAAHFHLHDGHPLSTFSPYGVSDHLSFFAEIPLNFDYQGRRTLTPMFGPEGLLRLVARVLQCMARTQVSLTLEIHETGQRLPLGDFAPLFTQWVDKTNAEKMNYWLSVLGRNHTLLRSAIDQDNL